MAESVWCEVRGTPVQNLNQFYCRSPVLWTEFSSCVGQHGVSVCSAEQQVLTRLVSWHSPGTARAAPFLVCCLEAQSFPPPFSLLVLRSGARMGTGPSSFQPFTLPALQHTQGQVYALGSWDFTSVITYMQSERFFPHYFRCAQKQTRISHLPHEGTNKVRSEHFKS